VSTHIVHKQKVDLKIARSENSFALQERVSYLMQQELPKKMEMIFDELVPADEIIRIDKLHLDLKTIDTKDFEKEFEERLIEELKGALSKIKKNISQTANAVVTNRQASLLHSLLYFLEHGYLEWFDSVKQIQAWEQEILNQFSEKEWEYFLDWLRKNCKINDRIIERLVLQFSDYFLKQVVSKTGLSSLDTAYEDLFFILQTLSKNAKEDNRNLLWKNALHVLLLQEKNDQFGFEILKHILNDKSELQKEFFAANKMEIIGKLKTTAVRDAFEKIISFFEEKTNENIFISEENVAEQQEISNSKPKKEKLEDGVAYVQNCGIVILHPFLEMYFTELGLTAEKQFINDDAHKRAVLLLHYLATGETEVAEFNLVLQKILCGLALEETLTTTIELSEKEVAESGNLLRSVMNYWPPLKNTSVAGLQQTFLQRDGKVSQTENGWLLRVEQKTVDILLGKLPWGFSTLQLPWMENILSIEWC
jgi:hypothetical protein